jgi:type VI secretion system protein VasG
MTNISRRTLFGKLNAFSYGALENATAFCKLRGHAYVELVHWIYQLLDAPDSDMLRLLRASGVDAANLARDVTRALDRLPRGATAISDFSPHLEEAAQEAWIIATLGFYRPAQRADDLTASSHRAERPRGEIDPGAPAAAPSSAAIEEIRQIIDILMRRRQNNPILTGEAGVGKTAVVEGLACASPPATCRRRCARCRCACSTSACCRPAPA